MAAKKVDGRKKRRTVDSKVEKTPEKKRREEKSKSLSSSQEKVNNKKVSKINASLKSGMILTMGQGDVGQLGLSDDIMERKRAALIKEVEGVQFVHVVCGGMHTVGVTSQGEVYTWGCNDDGALGRDTQGNDEEEFLPRKVPLPEGMYVVQASAGDSHTTVLTNEGKVYAWGAYRDASGQIGLTAASLGKNEIRLLYPRGQSDDPAVKVVSGNDHTTILTEKGVVYTNGTGEQGQLGRIKECFGHRGGRRGLDFILEPQPIRFRKKRFFSDVFAGSFSTFALCRNSNDVYAWGLNNYGQLGSGTTENFFNPEVISSLSEIRKQAEGKIAIESGMHHTLVLDGNGMAYCIGRAEYGRLGLGEGVQETSLPLKITCLEEKKVTAIGCGSSVSFAITDKGHLYSWGIGTSQQLGVGDEEDMWSPQLVQSKNVNIDNDEVLQVTAGGQHTAMLVKKRHVNGHTEE